ncbi:MAG: hypothetical protein DCC68_17730 [Planctomycetota bacterium]|nr:MAG: hypothetical protein DCC68_17730 [Planctomycetota bacterium]
MRTNISTRRPVIVCNDGAFGGSGVHTLVDDRMMGLWWWSPPISGRLPKGDAILVVDVDLDALAVEHGVANPSKATSLVSLAPVVSDGDKSGSYSLAQRMLSARSKRDNVVQASILDQAQQEFVPRGLTQLTLAHARHLAAQGVLTDELADCLLQSCIIPGAIPLKGLQRELAELCVARVTQLSDDSDTDDTEALACVARFRRECKSRIDADQLDLFAQPITVSAESTLDRESEAREVRQFIEHARQTVLCLTGLDDVGKSTLLSIALAQLGHRHTHSITLSHDATPSYIAAVFARIFGFPDDVICEPQAFLNAKNDEFLARIPSGTIVVLADVDNLRDHGQWRDPVTPTLLEQIAEAIGKRKGKLILTSTARIDLNLADQGALRRMYLSGLPAEFAKLLLDQHMRRVGVDPRNYTDQQRSEVVELLGFHPGAIVLCADYIVQQGLATVHEDLKQRRGVHTDIVRRILKGMIFTNTESAILSLLNESRTSMPSRVLSKALRRNVSAEINALIGEGVLERGWRDFVKLPDLVRGFADLTAGDAATHILYHKAAAEELREIAGETENVPGLDFAIASQFHANLAGDPNLGASLSSLVDGTLGSVRHLVELHEYERAKPVIERLLVSEKSPEVFQLGALVNARLGLVEDALTLAKEAYSADKEREWIVTEVGRLALHVHRTDIASECVALVRNTGHDSPYLATLEGKIALREGDNEGALKAFRRAVELIEVSERWKDAWPHFFLGRTLIQLGQAEDAIDVLYSGETIASGKRRRNRRLLVAIRTQLAVAYVLSKDVDGARRIFDLLGAEESGSAEVVWAYALLLAATGDFANPSDLAKETLQRLNPTTARDRYGRCQVHLFRALVFLAIGNKGQASEEFAKANRDDPRNVFVLLRWAHTLIELAEDSRADGDDHAARMCAEHAKALADNVLKFHPGNAEALRILERLSDDFNVL